MTFNTQGRRGSEAEESGRPFRLLHAPTTCFLRAGLCTFTESSGCFDWNIASPLRVCFQNYRSWFLFGFMYVYACFFEVAVEPPGVTAKGSEVEGWP